jgi:hypothetical protein
MEFILRQTMFLPKGVIDIIADLIRLKQSCEQRLIPLHCRTPIRTVRQE